MIQAISIGKQVSFGSTPAVNSKVANANVQQQKATSPYSKEFANASRSIAFAAINMNKIQNTENVSFKGMKLQELPKDWFFDVREMSIKDHYGVEEELTPAEQKEKTEESKLDFKLFSSNRNAEIPFYKYTPICDTSRWMPDGFVTVKDSGDIEYTCWHEYKEQFDDD